MSDCRFTFCIAGSLAVLPFFSLATPLSGHDSVVQIVAEAQGLARVAPADWPETGTFWLMEPSGLTAPAPQPPTDANTPVYRLADGQYLVDSTAGQLLGNARPGQPQSALAAATKQAEAVTNLISQVQGAAWQRARAQQLGIQQGQNPTNLIAGTNANSAGGLSLEITHVVDGVAALNLRGATNWVYAIWATTDLLAPWRVEAEVWPTDTNAEPFTVAVAGRDKLFLKAEDWTDVDSNGDGVPDWWLWYWFGNLEGLATNLDIYGATYLFDYENGLNPNVIRFFIQATNSYVNSIGTPVKLKVTSGTPAYLAVLVDEANITNATWTPYTSADLTVNLGLVQGWHEVRIGLCGFADEAGDAVWQTKRLKLDYTPPPIVLTSPARTVDVPMIQVQGFCPKELDRISCDVSNAAGIQSNLFVGISSRDYSPITKEITTNHFEVLDIELTKGVNTLTFRAADLAGNLTTANFNFTVDYSAKTNPPAVQLTWPQDGMKLCGSKFTVRGQASDPTVTVTASLTNTNGNTRQFTGLVERYGRFWLENLPLNNGTNYLSITITDVASNSVTTNIVVMKSALTFTINPVTPDSDLWKPKVNLTGLINDPNQAVWVNGVKGHNNGHGAWSATNVPTSSGGVANFNAIAYEPDEAQPDGSHGNP